MQAMPPPPGVPPVPLAAVGLASESPATRLSRMEDAAAAAAPGGMSAGERATMVPTLIKAAIVAARWKKKTHPTASKAVLDARAALSKAGNLAVAGARFPLGAAVLGAEGPAVAIVSGPGPPARPTAGGATALPPGRIRRWRPLLTAPERETADAMAASLHVGHIADLGDVAASEPCVEHDKMND